MNVLLLNPWQPMYTNTKENVSIAWPMGLLYVAATTIAAGHKVNVVDAFIDGCVPYRINGRHFVCYVSQEGRPAEGNSPLLIGANRTMLDFLFTMHSQPDVVGVSLPFSSQHMLVPTIIDMIKKFAPDATIVFGGTHATIAAGELLVIDGVDYVVRGEGEIVFPLLLDALEGKGNLQDIKGLCYRKDGQTIISQHKIIENLDALPFPAFDLLPIYKYYAAENARWIPMLTSRGCPYNCRFCSVPLISHRRWRAHSVERVLSEIDTHLYNKIDGMYFLDDNMSLNRKRFHGILEGIIAFKWELNLYAKEPLDCLTLDDETLKLMKLAGFKRVSIAAESGNDRVLKEEIGKHFTVADAEKVLLSLIDLEIEAVVCLVIGMPGETWAEIQDTVAFARRMKAAGSKQSWVSVATPIPGTQLYEEALEKGLNLGGDTFNYGETTFDGVDWKAEDLNALRKSMMLELNA